MGVPDRLRQVIDDETRRLHATVPTAREAALLSLIAAIDRLPSPAPGAASPDLITGRRLPALGAKLALRIVLEGHDRGMTGPGVPAGWAGRFLAGCEAVAAAGQVVMHVETGFMGLADDAGSGLDAWIATRRPAPSWRERADIDWWAGRLGDASVGDGRTRVDAMAYQLPYPAGSRLGGLAVRCWQEVVAALIDHAMAGDAAGSPVTCDDGELARSVAASAGVGWDVASAALDVLAIDRDRAAWHVSPPGVALPPLVRLGDGRMALSRRGLTTEPLFYIARELRRRDPEAYHNAAVAREDAFRDDLRSLFDDRRFVTGSSCVMLRWGDGRARTDIDAVVFDRKTGALGLFELKSQDPHARSAAELARQRDNMLHANRQVSGMLDWVNRHGADEILSRVDRAASKRFRVRKVFPFVLGRYLAPLDDGGAPDHRAAWGTWPQVLRLLSSEATDGKGANPIASLHARLAADRPPLPDLAGLEPDQLELGPVRLNVWPSFAAYRDRER